MVVDHCWSPSVDSVEVLFGGSATHLRAFGNFFSPGGAACQALVATRGTNGRATAAWRSATAAK